MPDEQAAVVVILASDDASYVTDQMINCHSAPWRGAIYAFGPARSRISLAPDVPHLPLAFLLAHGMLWERRISLWRRWWAIVNMPT